MVFKHLFLRPQKEFLKFENLEATEGSALAIEKRPRTVALLEGKLQPDRMGNHGRIFTNVQTTISRVGNVLFQKFKNLKSRVPRSITPKQAKTGVLNLALWVTFEFLSLHVPNTSIH